MGYLCYESPFGKIGLTDEDGCLIGLSFSPDPDQIPEPTPVLEETAKQLDAYFTGKQKNFTVPLNPKGTVFQKKVWKALCEIPYGETTSYGELARKVGSPKGYRAVGMANHCNPIGILIPCHRAVGASGSLTGYAGGLDKKRFLLELESKWKDPGEENEQCAF